MELKETLTFLKALKDNNDKLWFDDNRKHYQDLRHNFVKLVGDLIDKVSVFDNSLAGVDPKKCIFRINRDIRFSKDKSPYKTNFGAHIGSNGKKTEGSSYYIHIQPGNSFLGGGIYMPPPASLAAIRQEIDYDFPALKSVIETKSFQEMFGSIQGDSLKSAPKGYPKDHPAIEFLRLKSFYVVRHFSDKEILHESFFQETIKTYREALKFNEFINSALS